MKDNRLILRLSFALCFLSVTTFVAGEDASPGVDFARQVLPILSNKCFVCHGPDTDADVDLRLDSFAGATADRGGYQAIDPQNPEESELLARIDSVEDPMPPRDAEKPLTDSERELLRQWVLQGGEYAQHWAFVPPHKVIPAGHDGASDQGVLDALIQQSLSERDLDFADPADAATLARRTALVLTGLPPTPELLDEFLTDSSSDAFERFVDQLLVDPHYGEHQARYWLDAVRYGDTHGLHLDNRRGIYPYRDWVIHAVNNNLPIDQFITWQLAGDLLPDPTLEQLVATGYVRMNPTTAEGGAIPEEFQAKNNFDRVETLGTVFLGMSLTCARCHSHKYDPITQTEYYKLLAFFNSTAEASMDGNKYDYAPVIQAPGSVNDWKKWSELVAREAELLAVADNMVRTQENFSQSVPAWDQSGRHARLEMISQGVGHFAGTELPQSTVELREEQTALAGSFTSTLVAKELDQPRETKLLSRGEYDLPEGDPLEPGVIAVMGGLPEGAPRNRLGLAQWLTSPDHPLVARVLVNRLWQQVFGYGLVRTPEDFGLQGQQPTHPELLDWLAVELIESGWDRKHMLRLMVTSRTFQQSSKHRDGIDDPENRLLARGPSFRLDAEVLRDVGLWSSGLLDDHMGGEGIKPYQPSGLWEALMHPASNTKNYEQDSGEKQYRRSVYVYWKRTSPHPMMTLFDAPSRESSCVRRSRTNTPLQSLGLLNENQRIETARVFAERLLKDRDTDSSRMDFLFILLASRPPSEHERTICEKLLKSAIERYTDAPDDAQELLSIGETSADSSFNPAELAGWTQLTSTILASDLSIMLY